jgi:hypothetical protein
MTKLVPVRFGEFLVERRIIDEGQLLDALAEHWMTGRKLGESVARKGYIPAGEVERLLHEFQNLSTVYV